MKQVTAFLTFDDKLFEDEAEAREHEKSLLDDAKKIALQIREICLHHGCSFCPFGSMISNDICCPFQDEDNEFCSPEDWTLNF